METKYANFTVS